MILCFEKMFELGTIETQMSKPKIIVVSGPTATGKSDYAVELAREIDGEIISADSRQVYKGLNIGSGKITQKEMKGIIHHLLDVANPKRVFSVSQFQKKGEQAIHAILKKHKTPIIVGGTGFYIDALLGFELPPVGPNVQLRKILATKTTEELFTLLQKKDRVRAKSIDPHNKVRLVRALEIIETLGKVPKPKRKERYDIEWIYLDFPDDTLKERIHTRLLKRFKIGMIREVEHLHESGVSWQRLEALGLEYRFIALYLQKKLSKQEMIEQLESAIWHYAKRQRTWFKKYKSL